VLLLIPCHPLQTKYIWKYVIDSRLSDLDYIVNTHTRRKKSQICQMITQGFPKEYKLTVDGINLKYIFLICYICNWLQEQNLKIAGGVKQLTVPLFPDPNCSMPENDAQCVIPVKRTSDHSDRWADEQNAVFVSKQWCAPIIYLYGMLTL
jgi:hypothetical protein